MINLLTVNVIEDVPQLSQVEVGRHDIQPSPTCVIWNCPNELLAHSPTNDILIFICQMLQRVDYFRLPRNRYRLKKFSMPA